MTKETKREEIIERLKIVSNFQHIEWPMRFVHHSLHNSITHNVLKTLEEISNSDDVGEKLKEKYNEFILKKLELDSIYEELLKHD